MVAAYGGISDSLSALAVRHGVRRAHQELLVWSAKIYEMVINTNPCYAYLLACNPMLDQKLVIAHVYGHCDFFKNNAWFAHTDRRCSTRWPTTPRVRRYIDRFGVRGGRAVHRRVPVDRRPDRHLFAAHPPESRRAPVASARLRQSPDQEEPSLAPKKFRSKTTWRRTSIPRRAAGRGRSARERGAAKRRRSESFPDEPQRDVLLFLLDHAPLKEWQLDVLSIIRDEAYYFAPQGQTKIMNEGWASYWHSKIMTRHGLTDSELIDYCRPSQRHDGHQPQPAQPVQAGNRAAQDIEERWNRGQFGPSTTTAPTEPPAQVGQATGLGRRRFFEVRRIHNDVTFIDTFLTEFLPEAGCFSSVQLDQSTTTRLRRASFRRSRRSCCNLTNHGRPFIYVQDGNYRNRGELYPRTSTRGSS